MQRSRRIVPTCRPMSSVQLPSVLKRRLSLITVGPSVQSALEPPDAPEPTGRCMATHEKNARINIHHFLDVFDVQ